jgi:hypothetical protein
MYHRSCPHNEVRGLVGRVLGKVPSPDPDAMYRLNRSLRRMACVLRSRGEFDRLSYDDVVSGYVGAKRTKYERARDSLIVEPWTDRDTRVTAFVKAEKRPATDTKDPRIIQFRSARYTLELATYLKPMEHALLGYKGRRRHSRVIAKGLTTWEHAKLIRRKWNSFSNCRVLSIDCSRFDKHVSSEALKAEHNCWSTLNPSPELRSLLSRQINNVGRTMSGTRYKVVGNRMSGDYNTGAGNCLLMAGMVETVFESTNIKYDYLANSDDCLIFVEAEDLVRVRDFLPAEFLKFGHEVKLDKIASELNQVLHCQYQPVQFNGKIRMVRDWRKVVSQMFAGCKHYHEPKGGMRVMKSVAQCELVLNAGLPVVQALCLRILKLLSDIKFAKLDRSDTLAYRTLQDCKSEEKWARIQAIPVTDEARMEYSATFGTSPTEQVEIERVFENITMADIDLHRLHDVVDLSTLRLDSWESPAELC